MKYMKQLIIGTLIGLVSLTARADVLVLVHGYLGSAHSWEGSGVSAVLDANGWPRAGMLVGGPGGIQLIPAVASPSGDNSVYAVELPSIAPMMVQADHLQAMLASIAQRHPDEPVIVAAHSAGGVVARIVLVRNGIPNAKALITISTPHLGTLRAVQALDATDTPFPFCLVENFFGGDEYRIVKDSWGALIDLTPARPGNLLYWLNGQPHPDIAYHSILRTGPVGLGDELVPVFSQDMNNVYSLKGRSQVVAVATGHALNPQDGMALVKILSEL